MSANLDDPSAPTLASLAPELLKANINPRTGLSTDYMNHFNEMVMLMGLYGDDPELAPEILAWQPLDYCGHFVQSGFRAKDLALLGYDLCPSSVKGELETIVQELELTLSDVQDLLRTAPTGTAAQGLRPLAEHVEGLIGRAGGLINGHDVHEAEEPDAAQAAVDALFDA